MPVPFRSSRLWAFFDYSYRTRVDLDYFAARWSKAGISGLHVAAWHFYEPDAGRDAYLKQLIEACHRTGILVYAWLELPHVSEKFWQDHPEWREKTAVLQDAHLDWRKLMNLNNRDCSRAVAAGVKSLVGRFDWDGINLAELYFESLEGIANPSRFTPMNTDLRSEFQKARGFDPIEIFGSRRDAASQRMFLDFRSDLVRRMQEQWIGELEAIRKTAPHLELVLTHVDDRLDTGMRDAIGADAARVLPLLGKHSFTFLVEDPATVWHLGANRYRQLAERYRALTPYRDKLGIDLNIVERYQNVYPTRQQTGIELFQLVHAASPDLDLLPSAAAAVSRIETIGGKLVVESPNGVGIPWKGGAAVDGQAWPLASAETLWLPPGGHAVEHIGAESPLRIERFTGTIRSASVAGGARVEFSYQSASRAIAVLSGEVRRIEVDGEEHAPRRAGPRAIFLPRGQHVVSLWPSSEVVATKAIRDIPKRLR
jgi:hypothetical protein